VIVFKPSLCGEHRIPVFSHLGHMPQHRRPHAGEPRAAPFRCRPPWVHKPPP
jgi:hypothetical protein